MAPPWIDVTFTPGELAGAETGPNIVGVMIDVFRSSTSLVMALAAGFSRIEIVASPTEGLSHRLERNGRVFLGGERSGERPPGFDFGNSPLDYQAAEGTEGATLVFTSTNGVRALYGLQGCAEVLICGFVNLSMVACCLARNVQPLLIACAGGNGRFCLEDALCAGALIDRLLSLDAARELREAARAARDLYTRHAANLQKVLLETAWAKRLLQRHADDLPVCLRRDSVAIIPHLAPPQTLVVTTKG